MTLHRCTDRECAYFEQATNKGCLCHKTDEQVLREQRDELMEALVECARRLRRATIAGGTDPEFADIAVEKYTALIARATGGAA